MIALRNSTILLLLCMACPALPSAHEEPVAWNTPGAGNPFIPGYFADPTIKKFGDTYYIYATTDGNGNGYGPAQVWVSKDFRNWTNMTMTWPTTEVVWAPDVMRGADGQYHYFYCEPCVIHEGIGSTPRGPWRNILGPTDAVLVPDRFVENCITLDGQTFTDDDGSVYLYFGTWGIYDGFGCGVARMTDDMKSFTEKRLIPNTQVKDFFEAPYVLKKDGVYYFMYSSGSCHDHTYRVQYATSTTSPMGPYEYKGCLLETNADGTVHGPGHHSVLRDGDDYYIVYHRHNNPKAIHGFHRQVCIDRLHIHDGIIDRVQPTHEGVLPTSATASQKTGKGLHNLAYAKSVTASSHYDEWFLPQYAVDDNNATLWRPANCDQPEWLQIDLGHETDFTEVWTQFEYATYFYQYRISTSTDGKTWHRYADRQRNTLAGSPMVDRGHRRARYIRITVTGRQKNGHFGGIWNVKVFNATDQVPPQLQVAMPLVADGAENTGGMLGGSFHADPSGERLVSTFSLAFLLDKKQPFSLLYHDDTGAVSIVDDHRRLRRLLDRQGRLSLPKAQATAMRDLRILSYAIAPAETEFYMSHPVEAAQKDVPDSVKPSREPLVSLCATTPTTQCTRIENNGTLRGHFATATPVEVKKKLGLTAFRFNGQQVFRSSFGLPPTLSYSAPYTVAAWVLNPQVERNECIVQVMPVRNDLSTIELCNGRDPQNGLVRHNASFENSGSSLIGENEGAWQHWVITYDGYMERHYLNGQLTAEKNMMLLLRPQSFMQIGASFGDTDAFDGYLHALQLWDRQLTSSEIEALYATTAAQTETRTNVTPIRHTEPLGFGLVRTSLLDPEGDPLPGQQPTITRTQDPQVRPVSPQWQTLVGTNAKGHVSGECTLTSAGGNFNARSGDNGILRYTMVTGDFLAEGHVSGLTGMEQHSTPAYNEGGLMLLDDSDPDDQRIVQLGVFPAYNCGNMLTTVSHHGHRPQHPRGNGWLFDPYLQLQRRGQLVHARTSADGEHWTEMPGSPVDLSTMDIGDQPLKLGFYQVTYTDKEASFTFDNFSLWQQR